MSLYRDLLNQARNRIIRDALTKAGGSQTGAAEILGVPKSTVHQAIKRLEMATSRPRRDDRQTGEERDAVSTGRRVFVVELVLEGAHARSYDAGSLATWLDGALNHPEMGVVNAPSDEDVRPADFGITVWPSFGAMRRDKAAGRRSWKPGMTRDEAYGQPAKGGA